MATIDVTDEEMRGAATYLVAGRDEVQAELAELEAYIEDLTNPSSYLTGAADQMQATDEALAAQARG